LNKLIKYIITIIVLAIVILGSYYGGANTTKNETLPQVQRNEEQIRELNQRNDELELRMKALETKLELRLKYDEDRISKIEINGLIDQKTK